MIEFVCKNLQYSFLCEAVISSLKFVPKKSKRKEFLNKRTVKYLKKKKRKKKRKRERDGMRVCCNIFSLLSMTKKNNKKQNKKQREYFHILTSIPISLSKFPSSSAVAFTLEAS